MEEARNGYFFLCLESAEPGLLYRYRLNGSTECPDPASRFQPGGVHGPSQLVDPHFAWTDRGWPGIELRNYVLYELHVGTFTEEGNFEAIIPRLPELKDLGMTAIELMPVAQFSGRRNWGYDGVYPFAVQQSYGGPLGLKKLVDAAHSLGLAVALDVVYNHIGPEGNYFGEYGPYFTDGYPTPWGPAINFDGERNNEVRRYFIENALYWIREFHIDALRLDAVHAIRDASTTPFLVELGDRVREEGGRLGRRVYLMPESNQNDARLVAPRAAGGYGLDAQWNDDFHHALHALLTGERNGYYGDFGLVAHLAAAFEQGFVYSGQYSKFRGRKLGSSARAIPAKRLIVFTQNHDQTGNRMRGDRLSRLVSFDALKMAAGIMLVSPYLPLVFMGEEYGELAPFLYFVSHEDPALIEAVRAGRRREFSKFAWREEPPDPQSEDSFVESRLRWERRKDLPHSLLLALYKELLRLRREHSVWSVREKDGLTAEPCEKPALLVVRRRAGRHEALGVFNFEPRFAAVPTMPEGSWRKFLDSADPVWGGPGSTLSADLYAAGAERTTLPAHSFALFDKVKD